MFTYSDATVTTRKTGTWTTTDYSFDKVKSKKASVKTYGTDYDYYECIVYNNGTTVTEESTYGQGYRSASYTVTLAGTSTLKSSYTGNKGYHVVDSSDGTDNTYTYSSDGTTENVTEVSGGTSYSYSNTLNPSLATVDSLICVAAAAAGAEGSYTYTVTKSVNATPSKATTTYKYDKNGNLKSATTKASNTRTKNLVDATYGNTIYTYDDVSGELITIDTSYTVNSKNKYTYDTALKNSKSKRLKKKLTMSKSSSDTSSSSGYSLSGRSTYKIKSKKVKSSLAKTVELQQWLIQNGVYGAKGTVGLY